MQTCYCVVDTKAVTTPAQALSAIMLEAYKKYIVVSLLLHGKVSWDHDDMNEQTAFELMRSFVICMLLVLWLVCFY